MAVSHLFSFNIKNNMKNIYLIILLSLSLFGCKNGKEDSNISAGSFIRIDGPNLIKPDGEKFLIQGINLGNWLNPEGYMFLFDAEAAS